MTSELLLSSFKVGRRIQKNKVVYVFTIVEAEYIGFYCTFFVFFVYYEFFHNNYVI